MKEVGFNPLWVLIYTSAIMMVLRFFAGPVVKALTRWVCWRAVRHWQSSACTVSRWQDIFHDFCGRHALRRRKNLLLADDAGRCGRTIPQGWSFDAERDRRDWNAGRRDHGRSAHWQDAGGFVSATR